MCQKILLQIFPYDQHMNILGSSCAFFDDISLFHTILVQKYIKIKNEFRDTIQFK